jgi:hypothetical protein
MIEGLPETFVFAGYTWHTASLIVGIIIGILLG